VLKYRAVEQLGEFLDTSTPQLMRVIEINERTAQRRREQGALTAEESDRLARVARVTDRAVDALGDAEQAKAWLRTPNRALQGAAPLDLLGTDSGAELVTDELGRIEYGDLY
jgi:putative toxin-antitoxin system antitoxin component (TIGR02293 family)